MVFVLHEPKRLPAAKKNCVTVKFEKKKNSHSMRISITPDVVSDVFPKNVKKVRLMKDNEHKNKILLIAAHADDAKSFSLLSLKNSKSRKFICAWDGYVPTELKKQEVKFEKFSQSGMTGLLIFLPE